MYFVHTPHRLRSNLKNQLSELESSSTFLNIHAIRHFGNNLRYARRYDESFSPYTIGFSQDVEIYNADVR